MTKWWISPFIGGSYTEVHIWLLLQSSLPDQLWCMWAVFWRCRWMMTWGNGLEECGEIASWKMPICAWRSFIASPRVSVSRWALNKSGAATLALHIWLCYAFSCMTADWVTVMLQTLFVCVNRIQTYAGGTAATYSCKSSKSHNPHYMHSSAMPLKVLIIISIVSCSCDEGCWLWMIIIISRSTTAVALLCHQQHHPTDQGWIRLGNVFIQFNLTFQKHPSFDLCWHVTHWIIHCLQRATGNGKQSAIWQEDECVCSTTLLSFFLQQ